MSSEKEILIRMPKWVFELNLRHLIESLAKGDTASSVTLDFEAVIHYIPAAIVAVIIKIKQWEARGIKWEFINYKKSNAFSYFQRMNVFSVLGWDVKEEFQRHMPGDAFMPVIKVPEKDHDVAPVATQIAACIDPSRREPFQLLEFASSEAILNARQHAGGEGFVCAQFAPKTELARVGVSDGGMGIRESFISNGSSHYVDGMSELDVLLLALKPNISSTTHLRTPYGRSPNKGVGLSMMRNLMIQSHGYMCLISGNAWWYQESNKKPLIGTLRNGTRFEGTICGVAFQRGQIDNYVRMLNAAREQLGLHAEDSVSNIFI